MIGIFSPEVDDLKWLAACSIKHAELAKQVDNGICLVKFLGLLQKRQWVNS